METLMAHVFSVPVIWKRKLYTIVSSTPMLEVVDSFYIPDQRGGLSTYAMRCVSNKQTIDEIENAIKDWLSHE